MEKKYLTVMIVYERNNQGVVKEVCSIKELLENEGHACNVVDPYMNIDVAKQFCSKADLIVVCSKNDSFVKEFTTLRKDVIVYESCVHANGPQSNFDMLQSTLTGSGTIFDKLLQSTR